MYKEATYMLERVDWGRYFTCFAAAAMRWRNKRSEWRKIGQQQEQRDMNKQDLEHCEE